MKTIRIILEMYKDPRAIAYGIIYPSFVIAMCMLAEWLERQY